MRFRHIMVTIKARSAFHDLFSEEEAAELEMRAKLLSGINKWLNKSGLTQTEAAMALSEESASETFENFPGPLH